MTEPLADLGEALANIALDIQAIKLSPGAPFTWASGYRMPIYNDNRMLLGDYRHRALVADGFSDIINKHQITIEVVAGTVTAGISPGTTLADRLQKPFIYIRDKAKGHGLQNRIEGILRAGQKVLMVEDLVSTGGSSIAAVEGVREGGGDVQHCLCIFSYDLSEGLKHFETSHCKLHPLLTFDTLLRVAVERKYIDADGQRLLEEWRKAPFEWGERHGFPRIIKDA